MKYSINKVSLLLVVNVIAYTVSVTTVTGHESTRFAYESSLLMAGNAVGTSPCLLADASLCETTITLQDSETGESVPGLVRIVAKDGCHVPLETLFSRGTKLAKDHEAQSWFTVTEPARISVPESVITIEAFSGLETEITRQTVDLRKQCGKEITISLRRFYDAGKSNWYSGNTHLHIRGLTRQESDRYLTTIPKADDVDLVFVTYLERQGDDKTYISNEYSASSIHTLESPNLDFGWGQELRHYFGPGGEGYGHVLLLNLQELVWPVSIGPGLMGEGDDGIPLYQGMSEARAQGGSAIWCHNAFGFEDIPSWLSGILDAQNIFDGGGKDRYEDTFYRYLNIGLRVPFSTGTDWFMYDFSRVYVQSPYQPSVNEWLTVLSEGRSFITNGTFLELEVGSSLPGDVIQLQKPTRLPIAVMGIGRKDFGVLELVHNGEVIQQVKTRQVAGHYEANLNVTKLVEESGWLTARISGGAKNEMGVELFAHTSPVYVEFAGRDIFDPVTAEQLIEEMELAIEVIPTKAVFQDQTQWQSIRKIYDRGIKHLRVRLENQ